MADTLWLAFGGFVFYWIIITIFQRQGWLPDQVQVQGPAITFHTQYGKELLDRLAGPKRFWRSWGNFGVGVSLVVITGMFFLVIYSGVIAVVEPQPTAINEPQNVLVIPGVNEFLPLSVAPEIIFGLLIGLVIHEAGHGLFCRVGDIDIESMGVGLLAIMPLGFVEPDEKSRLKANRGNQIRMFAAGVTNNFAISIVGFMLLFGPVIGSITVAPGAPVGHVVPGSPAGNADLDRGDRITEINGIEITNGSDLNQTLAKIDNKQIQVAVDSDKGTERVNVSRKLFLTRTTPNIVDTNTTTSDSPIYIRTAGDEPVSTRTEFYKLLKETPVTTVTTNNKSFELIAGAYIEKMNDNSPLANVIDSSGKTEVIITNIEDTRVVTGTDLNQALSNTSPGETVTVTAYANGTKHQYNTTLTNGSDDHGYLGVSIRRGTGGITVDDFGVFDYPAQQFHTLLGGDSSFNIRGFIDRSATVLVLPLAGAFGLVPYNFAGFVTPITNFYTITGPLSFLGDWVFILANLLFWIGWININLGIFNLIPAYPLDGGHILRTSIEAVVCRLPIENGRLVVRTVTIFVSLCMGAGLLLMVFGPLLFG